MNNLQIFVYREENSSELIEFFNKVFLENNRELSLTKKDADLLSISSNYLQDGEFWALKNNKHIVGTIAIRKLIDCYEIRRFFILQKFQGNGYGGKLLCEALKWAYLNKVKILKAATLKSGIEIKYLLTKYGFKQTECYNNSSADLFWYLNINHTNLYTIFLANANKNIQNSLILNPTENFPNYDNYDVKLTEGLYVSERHKNKNDIVVFGGRNELIDLYNFTKEIWKSKLNAKSVDLKTLSGLNAHLIFFLCTAKRGDKILLLPEIAGGHFSTETMLKRIGMNIIHFAIDIQNHCVDINETKRIIEQEQPRFIFVDRSEGLVYEDFSWLADQNGIKVFDASQYLCQIIDKTYPNPFDIGFDYIISSLHKNYPGPQKSIIATKAITSLWEEFLLESKIYISNTHPENVFKSVIPVLDMNSFQKYSKRCLNCAQLLNDELMSLNLPIVERNKHILPTLHIWILPPSREKAYQFFSTLEELKILVNYRKLPYNLGFGLRLGVNAAVQQGLKEKHIPNLAKIIYDAYNGTNIATLKKQTNKLLNEIIAK